MTAKQLLIETVPVAFTILEEATEKNGGRMRIKGIFTVADEINGNGRVYTEAVLDREIEKMKLLIAENRVFSEADHPEDGKSRISNTAAMLTAIEKQVVNGRKIYDGEAIVLNTIQGKNLQEIIRAGGRPGVSSRGWGSLVRANWHGKVADIVQEDFVLKTFDFVIGQSTKDAEVSQFFEQMDVINVLDVEDNIHEKSQKGGKIVMEIKTIEDLRKAYPDLCEQLVKEAVLQKEKEIKESLEKDLDSRVMKEVEAKREEIKNEVIEEVKKSDEYQQLTATLIEVGKLVKPYFSETGEEEDDDGLRQEVADLKIKMKSFEEENKSLKEEIERGKRDVDEKEKVVKKIQEVTAGKQHESLLVERLTSCKTVDEVVQKVAEEEAFIQKLIGEVKLSDQAKGKGQVLDENKQDGEMDEKRRRARALAGVDEDVARQKSK